MALTRINTDQIQDGAVNNAKVAANAGIVGSKLETNMTYPSNLTVTGDLTVNGTATTVDTTNLLVEDPLLVLSVNATGTASVDAGFVVERGDDINVAWIWDETADEFVAITTTETGSTAGNVAITAYADIHVNDITANNVAGTITTASQTNITAVGTITTGTWEATDVGILHGGTGASTILGAQQNLDLEPGVDIQAYDIELAALASTTSAADALPYFTGSGTATTTTLSAAGRALIDDADAAAQLVTLGINATATELNNMDGDTAATATTVAGTDSVVYNDAGVMKQVTIDEIDTYTSATTKTLENKTLTAPRFANAGFIADANGNELIIFTTTASAVNEITYANAAAGGHPTISTTGTGTDINLVIDPKGTGVLDVSTSRITNVVDPSGAQDAATKNYVDNATAAASALSIAGDSGTDTVTVGTDTLTFAGGANITSTVTNNQVSYALDTDVNALTSLDVDNITIDGNTISSTNVDGNIVLTPNGTGVVVISSDLQVNGTTTTVNSTTITVDDPVFTLGGDTAPVADDNKDRGIEFRWHDGVGAKVGFFGYDDSASAFTIIPDATNTSEVFSGTIGDAAFGNIAGTLTTASQTNITGVGTITTGTWEATDIGVLHGGTGASTILGAQQNLDLEPGVDIQAYDIELAALASTTSAADALPYFTGSGTATTTTLSAFGRSIIDDVDEATFKATVNLEIGTDVQAWDTDLDAIAALSSADGNFIVGSIGGWVAESGDTAIASLGVTATGAELNNMDAGTAATATTLADADRVVLNDADVGMKQVALTDFETYFETALDTLNNVTSASSLATVGTITSGVWQGTAIGVAYGGTGATSLTANSLLTGDGTNAIVAETNITYDGITFGVNDAAVFNEGAGDNDFRIESQADPNMFFVDASVSSIGLGTATPNAETVLDMSNTTESFLIPKGNTAQRPATPIAGMVRYHSVDNEFEYYNGTTWVRGGTTFTAVASQTFTGDGSTTAFTINPDLTTTRCIVSINGIVQLPTTAYGVSGTTLTFTSPPLNGDAIEVRQLTTTTSVFSIADDDADTKIQVEESADEDKIRFDTLGSERMIIDNVGNVGIGTSSPNNILEIEITTAQDGINVQDATGTTLDPQITVEDTTNSRKGGFRIAGGSSEIMQVGGGIAGTSITKLQFGTDIFGAQLDAKLTFEAAKAYFENGNVGIGTDTPGDILDIKEAVNDGNPAIKLGASDAEELNIQAVYDTGAQTLDYVLFQTDAASATANKGLYRFNVDGTDILDIDDDGLDVTGNIIISGDLTVNGTTTTVNSTTITVDDPVIVLGGDTSTVETTKDRGVEAKWNGTTLTMTNFIGNGTTTVTGTVASTTGYAAGDIITISGAVGTEQEKLNGTWKLTNIPTGTTFEFVITQTLTTGTYTTNLGTTIKSKDAFFGLDQSTGRFVWIPQANNTTEVFTGTFGDADFGIVFAEATSARYADLAEKYTSDAEYEAGTVVSFGGNAEVTLATSIMDTRIAGVVSANPAYLMNSECVGTNVAVALTGRVPVKVTGTIRKGDMLVSAGEGYAKAEENPKLGSVIGKALEDFDGASGIIEVVVGRL